MRDFIAKISKFMEGRYGNDKLNVFLLILTGIIYLILLLVRRPWLFVIMIIPLVIYIFRALSRNINKRLYENRKFLEFINGTKFFIQNQSMKIKDFKTHRYVKCPKCKAQLRLKKRTGKHTIHCPNCNTDFNKNILF